MTSMTGNGKVITLVYDAFGNRVSKTVNGVTNAVSSRRRCQSYRSTSSVGGGAERARRYALTRTVFKESVKVKLVNGPGPTLLRLRRRGQCAATHTTPLERSRDEYEYDAFGNSFTKQGTTPNTTCIAVSNLIPIMGLYYLRAAILQSFHGPLPQRDPLADEGQRRYQYAGRQSVDGNGSQWQRGLHRDPPAALFTSAGVSTQLVRALLNQPDGGRSLP